MEDSINKNTYYQDSKTDLGISTHPFKLFVASTVENSEDCDDVISLNQSDIDGDGATSVWRL